MSPIPVDSALLCFIEAYKCPQIPLEDKYKKVFRGVVDFSSIDFGINPIHNSYLAVTHNGDGYPFSCGEGQINQELEMLMTNLK